MNILPTLENQYTEFKEGFSGIEKDICAFANSKGGKIYLGIRDDGTIKQTKLTNKLHSQIISVINSIEPRPNFLLEEKNNIIILSIEEGDSKPYKSSDGFYVRIGATSQKLKRDEIIQFFIGENRIHFDKQIKIELSNEEELFKIINRDQVRWFRNTSKLIEQILDFDQLVNLDLLIKKADKIRVTNACLLLFSNNIKEYFSNTDSTLFVMGDGSTILNQKIFSGNILDQLEEILSYCKSYLWRSYQISGLKREEIDEIPEFVLRELILNCLIHRDYFEHGASVQIKIFPEYIEFSNPGKILHHLKPEDLYGKSFQRNPLLSNMMMRLGYIEKAGTGLIRIKNYLEKNNFRNLQIKEEGIFFNVTLLRPDLRKINENSFSKIQLKIIRLLENNSKGLSSKQIATKLKISDRKSRLDLLALKHGGLVKAIRKGRAVLYVLMD